MFEAGAVAGEGRGGGPRPPSEISAHRPCAPPPKKKSRIRPSLAKIFRKLALH